MKRLNSKQLVQAHKLISGFHIENMDMTFDVPSLLQYCLENDLRIKLKEKKFNDNQIDQIISKANFKATPLKKGLNKVTFNFVYNDLESFIENSA